MIKNSFRNCFVLINNIYIKIKCNIIVNSIHYNTHKFVYNQIVKEKDHYVICVLIVMINI